MRISDWSSDVCSSDLALRQRQALDTLCFPPDWVCWLDAGQASERVGMPLPSGGLWFAKGQRVQPEPLLEALLKLPGVYCKARSAAFLRRNAAGLWVVFDAQGNEIASAGNVVLANAAQASALLAAIPDIPLLNKLACMHKLAGQVAYFTAEAASTTRRSEERRVGKECVSTCRSRWSTYH